MSATSTQKQQQQQQRYRINNNNTHQSRNTNAYIDREVYHRQSLMNNNKKNYYWNHEYRGSNDDFYLNDYYQHRNTYSQPSQHIRKGRQTKLVHQYNSKSVFSSSNNNHSYYDNIPPRHRQQQQIDKREERTTHVQDSRINNQIKQSNNEQSTKPMKSISSSSTNSEITNNVGLTNRKDLHTKNLATAAIAARQQNQQGQTNLGVVQTLMNSLILQQQQQPSQSQSTVQLQYQLTNALLATMIQQRLKETALQAQAQQIQAALPTLLAAQALVYQQQQQGHLTVNQQQNQSALSPNVAHPGTKFNNRPLVKFPITRPIISSLTPGMIIPVIRPTVSTNLLRYRLGTNTQQIYSTTVLPTYQQVQEIERGISLGDAIHLKNAIDIADVNNNNVDTTPSNNNIIE
ncbi:unnamed protein product [Adineta steineri]|uniref:Uncharacterized protein n=1 Tax=Adineta steineri TaxID=433720 RepID=A0A814RFW8_9BILA|nr:unnamed protein product [Adineta steineri]